ncbi:MAG: acetylserotonin O-methyltransferase [Nitrospirae bacterium]|nr:acetylserotonin O-methyltransferase [Nitrospirota bacterium]
MMPMRADEARELRRIWGGFQAARVLLTANNYRVFDYLKTPKTASAVAAALKTDKRAAEILMDALTGLGLLQKTGVKYRNTPLSARLLVRDSPRYQGDIIRHADILWKNWSGLDSVIRTGRPHRAAHEQESFIRGMHNLAVFKAEKVMRTIGLRGVKTALDLGGGPGTYAIEMAGKGVKVTLFDRPETIRIARSVVKKSGAKEITFLRGDILTDDIGGGYDLIFISHVLHSCSEEESFRIIRKSRAALNPGGRIAVQEFFIEKDRTRPVRSALFSVNMLVNTPAGRCYSSQEIGRWLSRAGFGQIQEKMREDTVLVLGRKR